MFSFSNQNGTVQTAFVNFSVFVQFTNHIITIFLSFFGTVNCKTFIVQWIGLDVEPQTPKM